MNTCGRCGHQDRAPHVRELLANREREARHDGRPFVPPAYAIEFRCADRDACRARVSRDMAPVEGAGGGETA